MFFVRLHFWYKAVKHALGEHVSVWVIGANADCLLGRVHIIGAYVLSRSRRRAAEQPGVLDMRRILLGASTEGFHANAVQERTPCGVAAAPMMFGPDF